VASVASLSRTVATDLEAATSVRRAGSGGGREASAQRRRASRRLGHRAPTTWPRALEDGTLGHGPADDRRTGTIAAEIARTRPEQDQGDGCTPPDLDKDLRRFVDAITDAGECERDGGWLSGLREYVPDAGPVPSSRFL
jgi:hypothetical protein